MKRYQIIDLIEGIVGIVGLLAGGISIYNYITGGQEFAVLITIIVFVFALVICLRLWKIRNISLGRLNGLAHAIHNISHLVRDEYHNICVVYKNGKLTEEVLKANLRLVGKSVVESISNALEASTGEKVFISIKYFYAINNDQSISASKEELIKLPIRILCRSSNSPQKEIPNQFIVNDHTDIVHIMLKDKEHFCVSNLLKYGKNLLKYEDTQYRDPNPTWEKMYRARITVPIRIKKALIDNSYEGEAFEWIGFLTATSPSTSAFPRETIESYVNFCKGCADSLFIYFERYLFFHKQIVLVENGG